MNMNNKKQEYMKQYYLDNIDKKKQYRKDNIEKIKIQKQEYYQNNKEKFKQYREDNKEYIKEYKKSDKGVKSDRLSCWRSRGLISEDYDKIYERFILTEECDNCGILLDEDPNTRKCMDHSHTTGEFRNILCNLCNVNRID